MDSVDSQRLYNCSALVLQQDLSIVRDMNRSELLNALEEALSGSVSREILRDQLSVCLFPGQQKPFDLQWWEKLSWALIFSAMLLVAIGGNTIVMWIVLATMAMSSTGYHYGWSSPSLSKLQANDSDIVLTPDEGSWVVSFFVVGTMFGPLIAALLVDTLGRKWSLLMTAVPHTIAGILLVTARGYWWFIIARCIAGVGSGMTYIVLPMYLGEIINDDIRGTIGAVVSQMMNAGILLTYCVGPWVNRMGLAGLGIAFPICFSSIFIWMPESPYFLMMKKRPERATESLRWLRGTKDVSAEITKIERSIEFDQRNAGTFRDLLTVPGNRKALVIIVGIVIAGQTSGIGAVLAYNGLIFRAAGSNLDPSISVIIVGLVQVLSGILTVFTVDLTGRKPLLLGSTFGSIVFLGAHRRMRTVTNYFLVNLSVSDLMMSLLNCVFNFIFMLNSDWPFGAVYCTVNNFVANVTVASSVFTLVAISFDRYMAIVRPLQHRMSRRRALLAVAMIWFASALLALPCLLYSTTMTRRYSNGQTRIVCYMMWPDGRYPNSMREYIYNLVFLGVTYLVPVTVMAVCYTLMGLELWGSKSIGEHTQRQKESMKSKRKVVRMFIIVVTIFAVCWLPYHGFFIFAYHHRSFTNSIYVQHVYLAFYWLAMSNAMVNPIIYYWMNNRFRVYFQQIICCCFIGRSRTQSRQLECLAELPHSDLARSRSGKASRTIQVYLNSLATEHYRDSNTSTKSRQQNHLQRSSSS